MSSEYLICMFLLYPQHGKKIHPYTLKNVFKPGNNGQKFECDENYIYFFSNQALPFDNDNVGEISDKLRRYKLKNKPDVYRKFIQATSVEDLANLYDYNSIKKDLPKEKWYDKPKEILNGSYPDKIKQQIKILENLERYEECQELVASLKINNI